MKGQWRAGLSAVRRSKQQQEAEDTTHTCHDEFSSSREATTTEIENSDTTQRLNGADLLYMFCISTHISVQ